MSVLYRKKPVVIEAFRLDKNNADSIADWSDAERLDGGSLAIDTLEGRMTASPGDYVIRGVQGEFYPCRGDIFEQTYEPVAS